MKNLLLIAIILFSILSCKKDNNYEIDSELCALLAEMLESDQGIRKLDSWTISDSLWKIQEEIDKNNTRLLIDITKKRGWVSKHELGCTEYIAPMIIFRHAPEEYWNEIRPLIEKEYAEKRMGRGDYGLIDNHIRGRPLDWYPDDKKE